MLTVVIYLIYLVILVIYLLSTSVYFCRLVFGYKRATYWLEFWLQILIVNISVAILILFELEMDQYKQALELTKKIMFISFILITFIKLLLDLSKSIMLVNQYNNNYYSELDRNVTRNSNLHLILFIIFVGLATTYGYFTINTNKSELLLQILSYTILVFTFIIAITMIFVVNRIKIKLEVYNQKGIHLYETLNNASLNINNFEFIIYKLVIMIVQMGLVLVQLYNRSNYNLATLTTIPLFIISFIFEGALIAKYDMIYGIKSNKIIFYFFLIKYLFIDVLTPHSRYSMPILESYESVLNVSGNTNRLSYDINSDQFPVHSEADVYMIFKLLHYYYTTNKDPINRFHKKISYIQQDLDFNGNYNVNLLISNINRASSVSTTELKTDLTANCNTLLHTIEDIAIREQLMGRQTRSRQTDNIEFKITSRFTDLLLELLPFYQTYINDIIDSLEPNQNKATSKILYDKVVLDKTYNNFFTSDYFLKFEIYNKADINFVQIKNFIENYHIYIKTRLKDWKPTFLPLILGVFEINYLNYNKIILLTRHPYAFSPFQLFKYWINVQHSYNQEKILISTNYTEVLDIKELEIKDNLNLHRSDYTDVVEIIKNDFKFLRRLDLTLNYMVNTFVIVDINNFLAERTSQTSVLENQEEISLKENNSTDYFNDCIQAIRKTDLFRETLARNLSSYKRENDSELLSSLDKVVTNCTMNTKYIIKIYFSDLFRTAHDFNPSDIVKGYNKAYANK